VRVILDPRDRTLVRRQTLLETRELPKIAHDSGTTWYAMREPQYRSNQQE
jgi:hypothetical protein